MTRFYRLLSTALAAACLAFGLAHATLAAPPDPGTPGPYPIATFDYNYGLASYFPPDLKNITTNVVPPNELDGRVYYPKGIDDGTSLMPSGPMPLIILLHGRHGTSYNPLTNQTTSGWPPPAGSVQIPSYAGYDFEGNLLASWGYVVVSIGADGINFFDNSSKDRGMLARAELMQKSLDIIKIINTSGGASVAATYGAADPFGTRFVGKIDMSIIGTMGHSRGGEGVVTHYVYNQDTVNNPAAAAVGGPVYPIKAVFCIAPVDYNRYIANNVPLAVILPYCDGDVSDNQGVHFYDDSRYNVPGDLAPKYLFNVAGADHDLYNTVWDPALFPAGAADDWNGTPSYQLDPFASYSQPGNHRLNSAQQEGTGLAFMTAFFRTYIGNAFVPTTTAFLPFMKGDVAAPASAQTTELMETYHAPDAAGARLDIDRFLSSADLATNTVGGAVTPSGLTPYVLAGGGGYPFTVSSTLVVSTFSTPPTLANFALPGQPAARQPDNTPSLYQPTMGGLSQLELGWSLPGASLNFAIPAASGNFIPYAALSFRTAVNFTDYRNASASEDFDIQLTDSTGAFALVPVSTYTKALAFPPGVVARLPKVTMNGVRIPLSAFTGVDLGHITSVKFVFDRTLTGSILLTDLAVAN